MKHMLHKGHSNCKPFTFMRKFTSRKGFKALVLHEGLNKTYRVPKNSYLKQWVYEIRGVPYWFTYVSLDMKKHIVWDLSTKDKKWRSLKNRDIIRYTDQLLEYASLINPVMKYKLKELLTRAQEAKGKPVDYTLEEMEEIAIIMEEIEKANVGLPPEEPRDKNYGKEEDEKTA